MINSCHYVEGDRGLYIGDFAVDYKLQYVFEVKCSWVSIPTYVIDTSLSSCLVLLAAHLLGPPHVGNTI